jgi:hypothetical protein
MLGADQRDNGARELTGNLAGFPLEDRRPDRFAVSVDAAPAFPVELRPRWRRRPRTLCADVYRAVDELERLLAWRPVTKGSLRRFATVELHLGCSGRSTPWTAPRAVSSGTCSALEGVPQVPVSALRSWA